MHGGSAPQVKAKAAERLREGVMPMLATLYRLANDESLPPAVQLAAVRDWLDRSGIKEHIVVEVEVKPWERLLEDAGEVGGIIASVDDDLLRPIGALMARSGPVELDIVPGEIVDEGAAHEPYVPKPLPTPPALGPGEVRIPSRRTRVAGMRR